jgi:hypothetical protein
MTFRGLTELQEQSWNVAHTSAIIHRVEMNGWNQPDHTWRWIARRDGLWREMPDMRLTLSGDVSRHAIDRDRTWMDDRGG